jgi:hypothetical protein
VAGILATVDKGAVAVAANQEGVVAAQEGVVATPTTQVVKNLDSMDGARCA